MSLSEQELQVLREIERSLMADDPKFGSSVDGVSAPAGRVTLRGVALMSLGLLLLLGGVALAQQSLWFVALSVVGFLVMFGAGVWMLRGGDNSATVRPKAARVAAGSKSGKSKDGGMGSRLEENFRRRFEER